jgi:hypothetical protein
MGGVRAMITFVLLGVNVEATCVSGDCQNGQGVHTVEHADGTQFSTFDGEFKDGKKHGRGVLTLSSGTKYDGEWQDGKRHGWGVFKYADGATYEGEWKDRKWNGKGVFTYASGDKYDGEVKDGKKHGKGVLTTQSGVIAHDGEWREDRMHFGDL